MKKLTLILLVITLLAVSGCRDNRQRNIYRPEAKNDNIYTTIGDTKMHQGEGYTLTVPSKNYRYEKDFDDGALEEKWKYTKKDDVEIKVATYKNSDEISARGKFLRDNDDYIFEDLSGYPLCGTEFDGDALWFTLYESNGTVYIVSWEYPKNTGEELKTELANIAKTFKLAE